MLAEVWLTLLRGVFPANKNNFYFVYMVWNERNITSTSTVWFGGAWSPTPGTDVALIRKRGLFLSLTNTEASLPAVLIGRSTQTQPRFRRAPRVWRTPSGRSPWTRSRRCSPAHAPSRARRSLAGKRAETRETWPCWCSICGRARWPCGGVCAFLSPASVDL